MSGLDEVGVGQGGEELESGRGVFGIGAQRAHQLGHRLGRLPVMEELLAAQEVGAAEGLLLVCLTPGGAPGIGLGVFRILPCEHTLGKIEKWQPAIQIVLQGREETLSRQEDAGVRAVPYNP